MSAPRLLFLYPAFINSSRSSTVFLRRLTSKPIVRPTPTNSLPNFDNGKQIRHVTLTRHGSAVDPSQHLIKEDKEVEAEKTEEKEYEAIKIAQGIKIVPVEPKPKEEIGSRATSAQKEKIGSTVASAQKESSAPTKTADTTTAKTSETSTTEKTVDKATETIAKEDKGVLLQGQLLDAEPASPSTPAIDAFTAESESVINNPNLSNIGGGSSSTTSSDNTTETGTTIIQPQTTAELKSAIEKLPKYYHNFDTYTMVKQLVDSGYTYEQSVIAMKIIRGMLSVHLTKAKSVYVTKSNVENETYLFRAACSELRTEVQNSRRMLLDRTRLERAQLQHDYDQLTQRFSEDLINLKDEVSSIFNDRKMTTRQEQRSMEVKIQELGYKLSVSLGGELRSEIEGLRWTSTRRGLIAIVVLAATFLSFISASGKEHPKKEEPPPRMEDRATQYTHHGDGGTMESLAAARTSQSRGTQADGGTPTGDDEGSDGPFVSLG